MLFSPFVCLNVVFTIPSATSKPRTTTFPALRLTDLMMVNSNFPRYSNLASEMQRNYLFKFKLVLPSVRSNTQMMASLCEQITNLFPFNSSS